MLLLMKDYMFWLLSVERDFIQYSVTVDWTWYPEVTENNSSC